MSEDTGSIFKYFTRTGEPTKHTELLDGTFRYVRESRKPGHAYEIAEVLVHEVPYMGWEPAGPPASFLDDFVTDNVFANEVSLQNEEVDPVTQNRLLLRGIQALRYTRIASSRIWSA